MHNNPSAASSAAEHASTRSFGTTSPKNVTAGLMRPVPQTPHGRDVCRSPLMSSTAASASGRSAAPSRAEPTTPAIIRVARRQRGVILAAARLCSARHALDPIATPVEGYHVPRARGFVKTVDVLRDDLLHDAGLLELSNGEMRVVWLRRRKGRIPVWTSTSELWGLALMAWSD